MYTKEYILRMIEMIGELIAGILGLIRKCDFQQAAQTLGNAYTDYLKQDASVFNKIKKEDLISELIGKFKFETGHLEILSELFFAEAELLKAKNNLIESLDCYEKSKVLLDYVIKSSNSFSFKRQERLLFLGNQIQEIAGGFV